MSIEPPQQRRPGRRPGTDQQGLEDMRAGKPEAWDQFFAAYWRWLLGVCYNMGIPPDDAEDVVQKLFLKLSQHIQDFVYDPSRGRFSSWLITILGNLAADYWREAPRDPLKQVGERASRSSSRTQPLYQIPGPHQDPVISQVAANELKRMLHEAFAELEKDVSREHWRVYRAYVIDDRPAKEVAAESGLDVGGVYCIASRLTAQLRQIMTRKLKL